MREQLLPPFVAPELLQHQQRFVAVLAPELAGALEPTLILAATGLSWRRRLTTQFLLFQTPDQFARFAPAAGICATNSTIASCTDGEAVLISANHRAALQESPIDGSELILDFAIV